MNRALLFLNTIRYLKAKQIISRIMRSIENRLRTYGYKPRKRLQGKIAIRPFARRASFLARRQISGTEVESLRFTFLNEPVQFNNKIDWSAPGKGRLWRYNLHYFDYLMIEGGLAADTGVLLMKSWIAKNPPGTPDAWDPFPTSLRIVNWIKYLSMLEVSGIDKEQIWNSLYEQIMWLERSLEKDLLANHYFKNLKALIFAGLFFEGHHARQWLTKGLSGIQKELQEQILNDGGHFERSPMYHSMILEDCIDLINVCEGNSDSVVAGLVEFLKPIANKMVIFLKGVTHPDGQIALFNDAAFGIEATPKDLQDYYERVTDIKLSEKVSETQSFSDSGYFVMTPGMGEKIIIDCGRIGPDYQPGHSHCDILSLELSLKGKRVIVDSGCCGYENGEIRQYNRGNAGHNTVTIDGENQSEVWGSHRCARRANPIYGRISGAGKALTFEGAHDGYRRLSGKPIHHRKIKWREGAIDIEDAVDGKGQRDIELRLHINPGLMLSVAGGEAAIRDGEMVVARINSFPNGSVTMQHGWYCPEFGKKIPCSVLVHGYRQVQLPFRTGWTIIIP